jgi:hypothetical protein
MVSCGRLGFAMVATGEVDAAIAQSMEALLQPGVEMVGLLPAGLQSTKDFAFAGRRDGESQGTRCRAFVDQVPYRAVGQVHAEKQRHGTGTGRLIDRAARHVGSWAITPIRH